MTQCHVASWMESWKREEESYVKTEEIWGKSMHFCLKYHYLCWFISCDKHTALMLLRDGGTWEL